MRRKAYTQKNNLKFNFQEIKINSEIKPEKLFNDKMDRNAIRMQLPAATKWSNIFK